jgi:membrane-associated phospholipid phosphatase
MLLATPSVGGHYFVDVLAGIAVAAGSIAVATHIARRVTGSMAPALGSPLPVAAE